MFRESSSARTYLRATISTVLAFLAALGTALVGDQSVSINEWVTIATATVSALGIYLGIGAATVSEPFYGKETRVEVPIPPAVAENEIAG